MRHGTVGFEAHYVVASSTGRRVIFGAHKHSVAIVDLARDDHPKIIKTTFDSGGQRLALSDELDGVLAAAYHHHGLAFYDASTGVEAWRRKDIKKVQHVTLSRDGLTAYCGIEAGSLVAVDLRTGKVRYKVRGARSVHESPHDRVRFVDDTHPKVLNEDGDKRFHVDRTTFAFLDIAFVPGGLILSESAGPVRRIDLATGREKWRYQPPSGSHVLHLGYREQEPCVIGIEWPYEKGGPKQLLQISPDEGSILHSVKLGDPVDCCISMAGRIVVTTEGEIVDSATGNPVRKLSSLRSTAAP